jgi:hypothetical protein
VTRYIVGEWLEIAMLKKLVESIKSIKSVGVKSAIIGAIAIVLAAIIGATATVSVTVIHVLNNRSKLVEDNSAHAKTIRSKDDIIADLNRRLSEEDSEFQRMQGDLNQRISQKNSELQRLQADFIPFKTVAIEKYTGSEEERLRKLADEIQRLNNPFTRPIASATARVEATIRSEEKTQTYMTIGGYLVFLKDRKPLLLTASTRSDVRQDGKGEATYKGDFSIEPGQSAVGKPIEVLQASDLIQMSFKSMPAKSQILRGSVSVVINGDTRFEFVIPPQQMQDERFFIQDVKRGLVTRH